MRKLAGMTAVITGASRGLGPFIARALAAEGARLVLAARSAKELEAVAEQLRSAGCQALAVPCDVTDSQSLDALVRDAQQQFGSIDILVNNAGVELFMEYHLIDEAEIKRIIEVNLLAPMLLTRKVLPGMLERGRGHIVSIASLAGKGTPGFAEPYVATKAGLIGFSASLRVSYRSRGVSASAIAPGFVAEVGMYHADAQEAGAFAPWLLGTTTPAAVARAVVLAIKRDRPEIIVNPMPTRPLLALRELSPRLVEWLLRLTGVSTVYQRLALARRPEERPGKG